MAQRPPGHQSEQDGCQIAEGADGAGHAGGDALPNSTWQPPPHCCPNDNRTAEQEQSDSVSSQSWVDFLHARSDPSYSIAHYVSKAGQDRGDTEQQLIESGLLVATAS
jgi:hypothetical protein